MEGQLPPPGKCCTFKCTGFTIAIIAALGSLVLLAMSIIPQLTNNCSPANDLVNALGGEGSKTLLLASGAATASFFATAAYLKPSDDKSANKKSKCKWLNTLSIFIGIILPLALAAVFAFSSIDPSNSMCNASTLWYTIGGSIGVGSLLVIYVTYAVLGWKNQHNVTTHKDGKLMTLPEKIDQGISASDSQTTGPEDRMSEPPKEAKNIPKNRQRSVSDNTHGPTSPTGPTDSPRTRSASAGNKPDKLMEGPPEMDLLRRKSSQPSISEIDIPVPGNTKPSESSDTSVIQNPKKEDEKEETSPATPTGATKKLQGLVMPGNFGDLGTCIPDLEEEDEPSLASDSGLLTRADAMRPENYVIEDHGKALWAAAASKIDAIVTMKNLNKPSPEAPPVVDTAAGMGQDSESAAGIPPRDESVVKVPEAPVEVQVPEPPMMASTPEVVESAPNAIKEPEPEVETPPLDTSDAEVKVKCSRTECPYNDCFTTGKVGSNCHFHDYEYTGKPGEVDRTCDGKMIPASRRRRCLALHKILDTIRQMEA